MTQKTIASLLLTMCFAASAGPAPAQVCTPAQECGDVNQIDGVTVADALGVLRRAIGLGVTLSCTCSGGDECPGGGLVETGQSICWDPLDNTAPVSTIPCIGTGQDGELRRGVSVNFVDNGDGTVTDTNTTLMWEKLSDDNSIHDWDYTQYQWTGAFYQKIKELNDQAFADHDDWRVPNAKELSTLIDYSFLVAPAVSSAFHLDCAPGCSVTNCSCTKSASYWTSTTLQSISTNAWILNFSNAQITTAGKTAYNYVRAVRGGY